MAKINCPGDCTTCELLRNGEVNPSECASIWGFMSIQKMHANMERMHSEIMTAIGLLSRTPKAIPGIEYAPNECTSSEELPTAEGAETPATPEV